MQDGIIKGTGNSRYLKSISNFLQQYPTYQDFVAALVAGTLPIDLNGINETGWDQLGTALNKANLLSDETAAALGLESDAVPDDALNAIQSFLNENVFRRTLINSYTISSSVKSVAFVPSDLGVYKKYLLQIIPPEESEELDGRIEINGTNATYSSGSVFSSGGSNRQFYITGFSTKYVVMFLEKAATGDITEVYCCDPLVLSGWHATASPISRVNLTMRNGIGTVVNLFRLED